MFIGELIKSPCDVVSFYIDKFPHKDYDNGTEQGVGLGADDIGREVAKKYGNVPRAILVDYTDGTRGSVLSFGGAGFFAACKLKGETTPRGTSLYGRPWGSRGLFRALAHAIQELFLNKVSSYPVERTLMTGGTLDAAMHSHQKG